VARAAGNGGAPDFNIAGEQSAQLFKSIAHRSGGPAAGGNINTACKFAGFIQRRELGRDRTNVYTEIVQEKSPFNSPFTKGGRCYFVFSNSARTFFSVSGLPMMSIAVIAIALAASNMRFKALSVAAAFANSGECVGTAPGAMPING
jgi:hypothetical protein